MSDHAETSLIPAASIDPIERLINYGDPGDFTVETWPDYPTELGLHAGHVPALISIATDHARFTGKTESLEIWAPTHAWRALGQLRAVEAIEPLAGLLRRANDDDYFDSGINEELCHVFAMIGPVAIPALTALVSDPSADPWAIGLGMDGLVAIAQTHPAERRGCVAILTEFLTPIRSNDPESNAWAVSGLIDLGAVESIDAIRGAFARDTVALYIVGDLEDVEAELGLRPRREQPKRYSRPLGLDFGGEAWERQEPIRVEKIGRNDPCTCGSGKKYKKCCMP